MPKEDSKDSLGKEGTTKTIIPKVDDAETIEDIQKFLNETANGGQLQNIKNEAQDPTCAPICEVSASDTTEVFSFNDEKLIKIDEDLIEGTTGDEETILIIYDSDDEVENYRYKFLVGSEGNNVEQEENADEPEHYVFRSELDELPENVDKNTELPADAAQFYCVKCTREFESLRNLAMHYKWKHYKKYKMLNKQKPKVNKFRCNRCVVSFDTYEELVEHRDSPEHFGDIKCKICNKKLRYRYLLDLHMQNHMPSDQRLLQVYKCILCNVEFNTFSKVMLHYEEVHCDELTCILCLKKWPYKLGFKQHLRSHRKRLYKCLPCDRVFGSNEELKKHYHSDDHKLLKTCKICKKVFDTPYRMREHIVLVHKKEKPHQCEFCGNIYALITSLNRHKLNEHLQGDYSVVCETCGKVFLSKKALLTHLNTHRKIDLACYICAKSVETPDELQQHLTLHEDHKDMLMIPGSCIKCNADFQSVKDLFEHVLSSHFLYMCYKCHELFMDKRKLHNHYKTHEYAVVFTDDGGVICMICNRKFKYRTSLRYHMFVHTGEKPYECNICNKMFRKPYHVKLHMRTHTKEKPYKCEECQMAFPFKTSLRHHMASHSDKVRCMYCDKIYKSEGACKSHMIRSHELVNLDDGEVARLDPLLENIPAVVNKSKVKSQPSEYHCEYCIRVFKSESACQNHTKRYHPQQQNDIEEMDIKEYLDPRRKDCLYCHRYFKSESAYENHLRRAHPHRSLNDAGEPEDTSAGLFAKVIHIDEDDPMPVDEGTAIVMGNENTAILIDDDEDTAIVMEDEDTTMVAEDGEDTENGEYAEVSDADEVGYEDETVDQNAEAEYDEAEYEENDGDMYDEPQYVVFENGDVTEDESAEQSVRVEEMPEEDCQQ